MINNETVKLMQQLIKNELQAVKTCFPCEVVEVNNTRVGVKILNKDTEEFDFPEVLDIPVIHLKAGNSQIIMPTSVGDKGIMFISTKSTLAFKNELGTFYKQDFDIDNSFYLGGLWNNTDNETAIDLNSITIKKGSSEIVLKDDEIVINSGTIKIGDGVSGVARVGDAVEVTITGGSSAGTYAGTITTGSEVILG